MDVQVALTFTDTPWLGTLAVSTHMCVEKWHLHIKLSVNTYQTFLNLEPGYSIDFVLSLPSAVEINV